MENFKSWLYFSKMTLWFALLFMALKGLNHFDWGPAVGKTGCFLIIFLLCAWSFRTEQKNSSDLPVTKELIIVLPFLTFFFLIHTLTMLPWLDEPATVDIGFLTRDAVLAFFRDHLNPYQLPQLGPAGPDPKLWGYHYGPMMLFAYWPCLISGDLGFKLSNVFYFLSSMILIGFLVRDKQQSSLHNSANMAIALLPLIFPRLWWEIFRMGVNDIFPVCLMLACLVALKGEQWFLAGLSLGLAFSAKFSPAIFLAFMLMRFLREKRFIMGGLLGLLPSLAFLVLSPTAFIHAVFLFNLVKSHDSTSLYSIVPASLHILFSLFQLTMVFIFSYLHIKHPRDIKLSATHYVLLMILIEISYREVHMNHLIWILPFVGLVISWRRSGFLT